jgi:hypothetical protein
MPRAMALVALGLGPPLTTSNLNSYTPTIAETTREPAFQRRRLYRVWGRLDRLHQATKKSSETPLPSTKTHHSFTNRDL